MKRFFYQTLGIVCLALGCLLASAKAGTAAPIPGLGVISFKVLNADGTEVIGNSHYQLNRDRDNLLIGHGDAWFKDGERDIEYDTLQTRPHQAPAMLTLDHKFYNADGSMQREIRGDFRTGQASCTRYESGAAETDTAKLDFTADSYGGSAVVLPLEQYLAQGSDKPFRLQALNCIPKPHLIAVQAEFRKPSRWSHYPGQTVEVDIKPDLGWLGSVLSPFLPQLKAWFDPSDNWSFVGGEFSRYFRGPRIMVVREVPPELNKAENHSATPGG